MPSPSTHQDSPKVPEAWPVVQIADVKTAMRLGLKDRFDRLTLCGREPTVFDEDPVEIETYIPVSALLSDEVVERFAARLYEDYCEIPAPPNGDFADESDGARERWMGLARVYLVDAIEQVGGIK